MDRRRARQWIYAAAAAALVVRLGFGFFYWTGKPLTHDEREYLSLAAGIAEGKGFRYAVEHDIGTGQRFGRAPGYPTFLALLRPDPRAESAPGRVKAAQSVLGAFVVLLIASIARQAAGETAGAAAAWLAALYPPLVWISGYVLSESLYIPIVLGCVLLLTRAAVLEGNLRDPRAGRAHLKRAVAAGTATGLAILVRPGSLIFAALAALFLARRRQLALAIAFAISTALITAGWTIRNIREHGRFILVASEGGVTFWTGNHPLSRGEGDLAANPALKQAEIAFRLSHAGLSAEEMEPIYYRDAWRHISGNPAWWVALLAKKAFYTVVPIGPSYTLHSSRYLLSTVVPYAVLLPFAVAGFLLIARHGRPPETLYLLGASVVVTSLMFFPQERFRIPVIDPLVIVCAAAAIAGTHRVRS